MDLFGLKKKKALETEQETQEYLLSEDTPFNVREAFNTLRTNVVFGMAPSGGKRLLVTSANQSEGKSTTSVNLAVALAQNGAKVLLIDADLRKPKLHKFFNTDYTHGLSRFLIGQETLNDALFRTPVKNLDLMTSGIIPPNPSELLGSSRMKLFLEKAEEYYDYIIIDTPPFQNRFRSSDRCPLRQHGQGRFSEGEEPASDGRREYYRLLRRRRKIRA